MKILVLTKRQYMGKDLLDDRFGRFRELPLELARLGHEVCGLCLSYRRRNETSVTDCATTGSSFVKWESVNLMDGWQPRLHRYFRRARNLISSFQPDVVWAGSDAYHAIFGHRLACEMQHKLVIDLYDHFEAFAATKLPGVVTLFRRAVKEADGVTFFSQRLADHVVKTYPTNNPLAVIFNGVRKDLFYRRDKSACRQQLNLPANAKIIGVAGALDRSRSIDTLFSAFEMLAADEPDIHLALAGARGAKQKIPNGMRIHDFHTLPHENVPIFLNALNLAVICYRQSAQGEYSFPQKAYEIIACGLPFVAAAVGSINELLQDYPDCLYEPENVLSLTQAIQRQLEQPTTVQFTAPSWTDSARQLDKFFTEILSHNAVVATHSNSQPST